MRATTLLKTHHNWRFAREVMCPQSRGSPSCGHFGIPTWEFRDKMPFGCGPPRKRCIEYYKGERGGFPQVRAMVSIMSPRFPVVRPNTKNVQTMH